jgi:hypothetical protein
LGMRIVKRPGSRVSRSERSSRVVGTECGGPDGRLIRPFSSRCWITALYVAAVIALRQDLSGTPPRGIATAGRNGWHPLLRRSPGSGAGLLFSHYGPVAVRQTRSCGLAPAFACLAGFWGSWDPVAKSHHGDDCPVSAQNQPKSAARVPFSP